MTKVIITDSPNCKKIFDAIENAGGEARFVGGCVRDAILKTPAKDIDLATTLTPEEVISTLAAHNIKTIPTGLQHGTVTAVINKEAYEITTLRKDEECFGRKAKVSYTTSWETDAARRDFTFNALYADINGKVYDYFNGVEDLLAGNLNFVGDPERRIQEDYLRILRAFRFHLRFCTKPMSDQIRDTICKLSPHISNLSGERIYMEMKQIFSHPKAYNAIKNINDCKSLNYIFKHNNDEYNLSYLYNCQKYNLTDSYLVKMALFTKENNISIKSLNQFWRISSNEKQTIQYLHNLSTEDISLRQEEGDSSIRRDIYLNKPKQYNLAIEYNSARIINSHNHSCIIDELQRRKSTLTTFTIPTFPLRGTDIKNINQNIAGVEIGKTLKECEKQWIDSDFSYTKDFLMQLARKHMK